MDAPIQECRCPLPCKTLVPESLLPIVYPYERQMDMADRRIIQQFACLFVNDSLSRNVLIVSGGDFHLLVDMLRRNGYTVKIVVGKLKHEKGIYTQHAIRMVLGDDN